MCFISSNTSLVLLIQNTNACKLVESTVAVLLPYTFQTGAKMSECKLIIKCNDYHLMINTTFLPWEGPPLMIAGHSTWSFCCFLLGTHTPPPRRAQRCLQVSPAASTCRCSNAPFLHLPARNKSRFCYCSYITGTGTRELCDVSSGTDV